MTRRLDRPSLLAVPAGDLRTASSRIRVFQLVRALARRGWDCAIAPDGRATTARPDILFVQKRVTEPIIALAERCRREGSRIVYDVDDLGAALDYWAPPALFDRMLALADCVTTCTAAQIAHLATRPGLPACQAIPNAIDYFPPARKFPPLHLDGGPLRVIWFGNPGNLHLFEKYAPALASIPAVQPVVVAHPRQAAALARENRNLEVHPWTLEDFVGILRNCHLALLMHDGDAADRSKGNNRMVTAIHFGVPALASATPAYVETAARLGVPEALFDGPASMVDAVERLRSDAARRSYLDRSQRPCWESYSPGRIAEAFDRVFYECLGGLPPADAASAGPASA